MAEDKEKSLTDETLPKEPEETSASWDWDAAVPQTDTSNITLDDLQETEEKVVEQPAEESEGNETEKEEEVPASKPDDDGLCIVCGKERGNSPSDPDAEGTPQRDGCGRRNGTDGGAVGCRFCGRRCIYHFAGQ